MTIPTDPSIATADGALQFHFIGHKPDDPSYAVIMQENAEILMGMGGLVHNYMKRTYPTVTPRLMDIKTWSNVIGNLPDVSVGSPVQKSYANRIAGNQVANTLLGLVADAIVTDGAPLVDDFASYLGGVGDLMLGASNGQQRYNLVTCTLQNYLVSNQFGGYYDYVAIVLRQVLFEDYFQQLKSACASTDPVPITLKYTEIRSLVQARRMRRGGADHEDFQALINDQATRNLAGAKNFFDAGSTRLSDLRATV